MTGSVARLLDRPDVGAAAIRAWYQAKSPALLGGDETPTDTLRRVVGRQG